MMSNFRLPLPLGLFLILVLLALACGPAVSISYSLLPPPPTITPSATPDTAQPTQPTQPASLPAAPQVRLAVITARANIIGNGNVMRVVQQAQSADLEIGQAIETVPPPAPDQQSYSILYVPDFVNVELIGRTQLLLAEGKQDADGWMELTLDLQIGHLFVQLNEERPSRVTVQTPYATITTLTNDTEFDVCRTMEITCIVVKRGIVEVIADDKRDIIRAGSAAVVENDQSMSSPVCAPVPLFLAWEDRYRFSALAPSLQEEIAALRQAPCPVGADGLPLNARILYEDEFTRTTGGWEQGEVDNFMARYVRINGGRYYQVLLQGVPGQYLATVPDGDSYGNANIMIKARTEAAGSDQFRYGVIFRRSGNQYYAFVVSPLTERWYFLKSSSTGMEVLKHGVERRIRGLDGQDTLHVETYGSTFLAFINGRVVDWVSDPDYASGEAGLFVDTTQHPDARVNFNSIVIWDLPAPLFEPDSGENCFNAMDDDGDGRIDQADPGCQAQELLLMASPTASPLPSPTHTADATPTPGAIGTPTAPPAPTVTSQPPATQPPIPTLALPTLIPPLPTLALPTISLPLPTVVIPLPTIALPTLALPTIALPTLALPTISLPILQPPATPTPGPSTQP
jgi:hypothetical protein